MPVNLDQLKSQENRKNWQPRFACKFRYIHQDILLQPFKLHLIKFIIADQYQPKMFISEAVLKCNYRERFDNIRNALSSWDISQIAAHTNRIWIKCGRKVFPAFVRWSELCKLAKLNQVGSKQPEIADLTRFVFELKKGKLTLTGEKQNPKELNNSQIREKIADHLSGKSHVLPPILYADVTPDGKVKIYKNNQGWDIYLRLKSFGKWMPGSIAAVKFVSARKIEVTIYKRNDEDSIYSFKYEMLFKADKEDKEKAQALNTHELKPTMDISALPDNQQAKIIAAWIWDEAKLSRAMVKRRIGKDSICQLCSVKGVAYQLRGIRNLYPKIRWVRAVEKEEEMDGNLIKTATLYPPGIDPKKKPDKWFAVFWLPPQSYQGVLIKKK